MNELSEFYNKKPLITVITVVFNGENLLEKTILSVISQTYPNIEYIIIDGNSIDGTVDVIKKYENKINYWVSEPDKGIYDAMNKSLEKANGEWISFMNCGDLFFNNTVIQDVFQKKIYSDILYGDNILKYNWGNIVLTPDVLTNITKHMVFGHQTTFVKRSILMEYKFDCKYKIAADYNLFFLLYKNGYVFEYIPKCISVFNAEDGVSSNNPIITFKEDAIVTGRNLKPFWYLSFILYWIKIQLHFLISFILPTNIIIRLRKKNILANRLIKGNVN